MESTSLSFDEVVEKAKVGDASALTHIYERYGRAIRNYTLRLLGNAAEADDATQETFLRAFQKIGSLRDESRIESWLYSIASHYCLDTLRRRKVLSWLPLLNRHEDHHAPYSNDLAGVVAESELVRKTLSRMPPQQAACLVLRSVEGFSCEEIAEILGISRGAVWTRLSRARELFVGIYDELSEGKDT